MPDTNSTLTAIAHAALAAKHLDALTLLLDDMGDLRLAGLSDEVAERFTELVSTLATKYAKAHEEDHAERVNAFAVGFDSGFDAAGGSMEQRDAALEFAVECFREVQNPGVTRG